MPREGVRPTIVVMETTVHEIADGVYRLSTYLPDISPAGFTTTMASGAASSRRRNFSSPWLKLLL